MGQKLFPGQLPHATYTLDQIDCLCSASRAEVYWNCSPVEPRSISDIAKAIGRSANATTYHINELHRVGLLLVVGERPQRSRREKLYVIAARRGFTTDRSKDDKDYRDKLLQNYAAMLRLMLRERERLTEALAAEPELIEFSTYRRYSNILSKERATAFREEIIERFRAFAAEDPDPDGVRTAISFIMTPIMGESNAALDRASKGRRKK